MFYTIGLIISLTILFLSISLTIFQEYYYTQDELPKSRIMRIIYRILSHSRLVMYLITKFKPLLFALIVGLTSYPLLFFLGAIIIKTIKSKII